MKDGRYILGVIRPDGKKLKGELETKDPQEAEKISIAYIKSYNARVIAEQKANQAEQKANQAEQKANQAEQELVEAQQQLDVTMEKLRNLGNVMAEKAAAVVYKEAGKKKQNP
jgi:paraquat-inducible protein B